MRIRALIPLAGVALVSAACATSTTTSTSVTGTPVLTSVPSPVVVAVDPVGQWSISLVAQGEPMDLAMDVRSEGGVYSGTLTNPMLPPMQFTDARLEGNRMVISLMVPTGDRATMNLQFDGDALSGDWSMPGDGGKLTGKRM